MRQLGAIEGEKNGAICGNQGKKAIEGTKMRQLGAIEGD